MLTPTEQLAELRPLLRIIARERTATRPWMADDAEQEAMIIAWQRLEAGHPKGFALHAARQAVTDVARGRRPTGAKRPGVPITDGHVSSISIFKSTEDGEYVYEPEDPAALDAYEAVELASLLSAPLCALGVDEREILRLVFWEGRTQAEVGERFGITGQAISLRLKRIYETLRHQVAA